MAKFGKSDEFRYEVIRTLGEIPGDRKWKIRLNLISWNGSEPKYDIRPWSEDGNSMGKGISMSKEELLGLKKILDSVDLFTSTFIGKLPIELPLGKMYGRFIALQDEKNVSKSHESLYDFYGYFILPDAKVAIPTASALKLLGRSMGYNLSITHQDTLMEISGISISADTLAEFISSYIQFFDILFFVQVFRFAFLIF